MEKYNIEKDIAAFIKKDCLLSIVAVGFGRGTQHDHRIDCRNSTKSTTQPGIALLAATLARMLLDLSRYIVRTKDIQRSGRTWNIVSSAMFCERCYGDTGMANLSKNNC